MEDADPNILARLHEPEYMLIDSGDALADLRVLSQNDFLLLGQSSYAALVHLIAPPGLTIIDGNDRWVISVLVMYIDIERTSGVNMITPRGSAGMLWR
jgi:hypothetical protein